MPLPKKPTAGLPSIPAPPSAPREQIRPAQQDAKASRPKVAPAASTRATALRRKPEQVKPPQAEPAQQKTVRGRKVSATQDQLTEDEVARGYAVDLATGKKYKRFAQAPKEAIDAFKRSKKGLTVEEMFEFTELDDDFDLSDLNGSASTFLAHLRVPPNKEEQARIIAERKRREVADNLAYQAKLEQFEQEDKVKSGVRGEVDEDS